MTFYDLVHGYQPFSPPNFIPDWVERNLQRCFVPTSKAMRRSLVKRGIQIQGKTIEDWLKCDESIKRLATEVVENLSQAAQKNQIEIGASTYVHAILPLLSEKLIAVLIKEDFERVETYLGKPVWFWPPEGAVDQKVIRVLHQTFPNTILALPDRCLDKQNFSDFIKIKFEDGSTQKTLVFNTVLKDVMMNAEHYPQKPSYVPEAVDWSVAQKMVYSGESFREILTALGGETHILMRDWENKGSVDGLTDVGENAKELKGLLELEEVDFRLPSEVDWNQATEISITDIKPGSWEPDATPEEPYPYWSPADTDLEVIKRWQEFINLYCQKFEAGKLPLESSVAIESGLSWHILARKEWGGDPGCVLRFEQEVVLPELKKIGDQDIIIAVQKLHRSLEVYLEEKWREVSVDDSQARRKD